VKQVPLRAVFFDVGGTLLRPHPSVGAIYARVGRRHGFTANAEGWERAFRAAWKTAKAGEGMSLTAADKSWWRSLVFLALDTMKLEGDNRTRHAYFEELFASFGRADAWQLYTGAVEVLRGVRARGLHVGAISNWDARLRPLLRAMCLDGEFDSITVSCEVKVEKPAPEIFQAALRTVQADPMEALHVGDSYEEDVRGAKAVGMHSILIDRKGWQQYDCPVVRDLKGILAVLG
jgi:putative hydrolase of the HAD superfamily